MIIQMKKNDAVVMENDKVLLLRTGDKMNAYQHISKYKKLFSAGCGDSLITHSAFFI